MSRGSSSAAATSSAKCLKPVNCSSFSNRRAGRSASDVRPRSADREVVPEGERIGDVADRLERAADASDRDYSVTGYSSGKGLVDRNAFDFGSGHLECVTPEQTGLVD